MKSLWIIALCLHLIDDKRLDTMADTRFTFFDTPIGALYG